MRFNRSRFRIESIGHESLPLEVHFRPRRLPMVHSLDRRVTCHSVETLHTRYLEREVATA